MKSQGREGFQMTEKFKCKRCGKGADLIVENDLCWDCYMSDIDEKLAWQRVFEDVSQNIEGG